MDGSASARSASPPPTLATPRCRGSSARQSPAAPGRRGSNVRQGPAAPGQQRRHARICTRSCSTRSVAIRINGDIRRLKLRGTASPRAPRHRSGRLARKGHGNDYPLFARTAKEPWTKHLRSAFPNRRGAAFLDETFSGLISDRRRRTLRMKHLRSAL